MASSAHDVSVMSCRDWSAYMKVTWFDVFDAELWWSVTWTREGRVTHHTSQLRLSPSSRATLLISSRKPSDWWLATIFLLVKTVCVVVFKHCLSCCLQVRYQLVESSKFQKDMRVSPELNIYYRICRLKLWVVWKILEINTLELESSSGSCFRAIEQREENRDPEDEMLKILSVIMNREFKSDKGGVVGREKSNHRPRSTTPDER